jgi:hypothetical protein
MDEAARSPGETDIPGRVARATTAFVALGVVLRVLLYAANAPLWGDEACLAFNFLDRGYLDLLRPLDYGQVAPPLFLWAERATVDLLGFSEWSLRLVPLLCGIASVFLFRRLAGLALGGVPQLLAVAIFAVSVHPIRHSSDVKPYASDLLFALALLTPAFAWLRRRDRVAPLWALVVIGPVALLGSYPAVFVAGGVGLGLAWPVWRSGRAPARLAMAAYGLAVIGTALAVFALVAKAQGAAVGSWMGLYWARAFPPMGAWPFVRWLFLSTAGSMLSYPDGGRDGGSTATFLLVVVAGVALFRSRRRAELAMLLAPFALTLAASAVHRYPYGGEARTMQFVAPAVCLMAGLGAATLMQRVNSPARRRLAIVTLGWLTALGLFETGQFVIRPARSVYDERVRAFARDFWPSQARYAEVACLRRDFGIVEDLYARRHILNGRTPVFVCNRRIYSPPRAEDGPHWDRISASHPLRCVLFHETEPDQPEVVAWLDAMRSSYDLARTERFEVNIAPPGVPQKLELIRVYEFTPRPGMAALPIAFRPSARVAR